jgi:hypothetical protein
VYLCVSEENSNEFTTGKSDVFSSSIDIYSDFVLTVTIQ